MRIGITTSIATAIAVGVLVAASGGGACAFPSCFPSAATTGVPTGTSLTEYTGSSTITTDNTTINAKHFTGLDCPLEIRAANVTITNSFFDCATDAIYVFDQPNWVRATNGTQYIVTISDSEISCGETSSTGFQDSFTRLIRVEIHNCENDGSINQLVSVQDSFVHDLFSSGAEAHEDGFQHSSSHWNGTAFVPGTYNVTYQHNTIFGMSTGDTLGGTSAIIMNRGPTDIDHNILVQDNLLAGGSVSVYCEQDGFAGVDLRLIDNRWSTQFYPTVGASDPSADCADETLSGNVYYETGLPITLP